MEDVRYEPVDGELDIAQAVVQAAFALDSSATIAERQSDAAGLLAVAESWMKVADFLAALRDSENKADEKKEKAPFGFQPQSVDLTDGVTLELQENEEEEVDVRDNDED